MKHLYCLPAFFIIFIFSFSSLALASVPEGVTLTKTQQGYHIDFTLPGYQFEQVTAEGNEYLQLTIPEYGVMANVGLPSLPIISFNLFISQTENQPVFEIKNIAASEINLKHKIYPFQMARVIYVPFDLPLTVNRALDVIRPSLLVIMETELWPNLIRIASARRIPVLLVNGRISERSYRGYRRIGFFVRGLLREVTVFCMQNELYAERIRNLGAPPERVRVLGSLKFDAPPLLSIPAWTAILRRPIIVGGSTHRSEEDLILDAFVKLRQEFPDLNVFLAPRHPERFREVEDLTKKRGLAYLRRSDIGAAGEAERKRSGIVVILDAMGELSAVYGACDVAVMGGSGAGKSTLEPAPNPEPKEVQTPQTTDAPKVTQPQIKRLWTVAKEFHGKDAEAKVREAIATVASVEHTADIPASKYDAVIEAITKKEAA